MRTIAVASGKGGVGKTSVAVHIAWGLAREGARTLLVDIDPGGHATTWLAGFTGERPAAGIAEAVIAHELGAEHVTATQQKNLFLAPSTEALKGLEAALAGEFGRETILYEVLRQARKPQFDFVVIDCPPTTGFLTQSAVCAATDVISPLPPGFMGLSGVVDIQGLVAQVKKRARKGAPTPLFLGAVLFASDDRESITRETRAAVSEWLFDSEVRVSTVAKRLPEDRKTAWDAGADPRGAIDYAAILGEMKKRLATTSRKAR